MNIYYQFKVKIGLIALLFLSSCHQNQEVNVVSQKKAIDSYIKKTMNDFEIPGVALAILKDGAVFYQSNYGKAAIEYDVPISKNSVFRIYSISKLMTTVAIFQLIEKQQLSLEDPISKYLEVPKNWEQVQVKHLLTHSSGLPELGGIGDLSEEKMQQKTFEKENQFVKGKEFRYTQTNYWLLKQLIEKLSAKTFEEVVLEKQFLNAKDAFFSSNSYEIVKNRVTRYNTSKYNDVPVFQKKMYTNRPYAHSGNGLNVTLNEFITWNKRLDENELIKKETKQAMWNEFIYEKPNNRFTLGWGIYPVNDQLSYGFTGGTVTGFRKFTKQGLTIIWLTNGYKKRYNMNTVINHIAGMINPKLIDKTPIASKKLLTSFEKENITTATKKYHLVKEEYPFVNFENILNNLGYTFMGRKELEKAIKIFELNTIENPNSANVFDSLGEAYFVSRNLEKAIQNYQKAVDLGGTRGNAKKMLAKIREIKKK